MEKTQYVVIGLGRFGTSVAKTLYSLGHDVLAIDKEEDVIQEISESVTYAIQLDATEESALKSIGVKNFDIAVVTIGTNIQASTMITLLLKEMGVGYIVAKAHNELHAKILYKIGADRVVLPEKDMGVRVAHNLISTNILDYIELSPDYSIAEILPPKDWNDKTLMQLNIRAKYGINIMAIKKGNKVKVAPAGEDLIEEGDIIVAIGNSDNLSKIESMNKKINR